MSWEVPRESEGDLTIWDLAGRKIMTLVSGSMSAGSHRLRLDASSELPAGLYFLRLRVAEVVATSRMILLRRGTP